VLPDQSCTVLRTAARPRPTPYSTASFTTFLMLFSLLAAVALCHAVHALSENTPLVARWSSRSPLVLSTTEYGVNTDVMELLTSRDEWFCDQDGVVLIEQPGLRARDLQTESSPLLQVLRPEDERVAITVSRSNCPSSLSLSDIAEGLAQRCNMKYQQISLGNDVSLESHILHDRKTLLHLLAPPLLASGGARKQDIMNSERYLSRCMSEIEASFSNLVYVYTGSASSIVRRQFSPSPNETLPFSAAPVTSQGGIFSRYQLLTPGLITTLLVTFFLVIPIVLLAVRALASISSTLRLDGPKNSNADRRAL